MKKLTFKEYLETKERLRESIKITPRQSMVYVVEKYSTLVVGESKESKELIKVKPKQEIIIEWLYLDINKPTLVNVTFNGTPGTNTYKMYWSTRKIQSWLNKNTNPKI